MPQIYGSYNGTSKAAQKIYVGVNGAAKEAKTIYVGVNGSAVKVYPSLNDSYLSRFSLGLVSDFTLVRG